MLPSLMARYPWITPWNVYDIPFDLLTELVQGPGE